MLEILEKIKTDFSEVAGVFSAQLADVFETKKRTYPHQVTLLDRKGTYSILPDTGELDESTFLDRCPYNKTLENENQMVLNPSSLYYFYFNYPKLYSQTIQARGVGFIFGSFESFIRLIDRSPNMASGAYADSFSSNKSIAALFVSFDNLVDFLDLKPGIAARLFSRFSKILNNVSTIEQMKVVATRLPEIKRPLVLQNIGLITDNKSLRKVLVFAPELTALLLYRYNKIFLLNSEIDLSAIIVSNPDIVYKLLDKSTGAHYQHVMALINQGRGNVFRAILRAAPEKAEFIFETTDITLKRSDKFKFSFVLPLKTALRYGNAQAVKGLAYLDKSTDYQAQLKQAEQQQSEIMSELKKIQKQFMQQLRCRSFEEKVIGIKQNRSHLQKFNQGDGAHLISLIKKFPEVMFELVKYAQYTNVRYSQRYCEAIIEIVNSAYYRHDVPAILSWLRINIYGMQGLVNQSQESFDAVAKKIGWLKRAASEINDTHSMALITAVEQYDYHVELTEYYLRCPRDMSEVPLLTLDILKNAKKNDPRLTSMQNIYAVISGDKFEFERNCSEEMSALFERQMIIWGWEHEIDEHSHLGSSFLRVMGWSLMNAYQFWQETGNDYHKEALNLLKEACRFGHEDAIAFKYSFHKSRLEENIATEDDVRELLLFSDWIAKSIRPKPFYYAAMAFYCAYKYIFLNEAYKGELIVNEQYLLINVVKFLYCAEAFNDLDESADVKELTSQYYSSWCEIREKLVGCASVDRASIMKRGEADAKIYIAEARKNFQDKSEHSPALFDQKADVKRGPVFLANKKVSHVSPADLWGDATGPLKGSSPDL